MHKTKLKLLETSEDFGESGPRSTTASHITGPIYLRASDRNLRLAPSQVDIVTQNNPLNSSRSHIPLRTVT